MCGIYGSTFPYEPEVVKSKLERTNFRGPDKMDWKYYETPQYKLVFGHNRLSIIDLDPRSNQPFSYLERIHLVFNGEIYNFQDIKANLINKGYQFSTTSDTEVICAAYLEYGERCVEHFNGMFALVLYDVENHRLFGARDRLGQKPFYYLHNKEHFEFASQVSSIQKNNEALSLSGEAIYRYLAWGVIPDPYSIYNEVKKLEAGHYFTYDLHSYTMKIDKYWDIDYKGDQQFSGSYKEALEELEGLMFDAVKSRLFADVPVGVFLSGGVDSSAVAAAATRSTSEKVKTFSVKFNEKGFDESSYAQKVADHIESEHHVIECDYKDGLDLIENFSYYYDEPFADSSAIPSMLLAKNTRKYVTVALSGDGGDESFLGYHRYNWLRYINGIYQLPSGLRLLGANVLNNIPYYKLKVIAGVIKNKNASHAYQSTMYDTDFRWLENGSAEAVDFKEQKYLFHNEKNIYERASDFDIKTYLNWDINTKVDRASMAYSLEARAPLMDYRIVEFARSLPTGFKFKDNVQKRILKDLLYRYVPKELFKRPKSGFTMPFKEWFKTELKDKVLSELGPKQLAEIPGINPKDASLLIEQHMKGTANNYPYIWKLLVIKQWLRDHAVGVPMK